MFTVLISCGLKLQTIIKAIKKLKPALKRHTYHSWALKFTPFHQLVAKEYLCEPNIGWN